jgi:phosphatidate cytidylyltransferase
MTRVLSGVVLAAAAVAAIWFLPLFALRIVACLVAVLAAHEYLRVASGSAPLPALLLVALACWSVSTAGGGLLVLVLAVGWVAVEVLWGNVPIQQAAARFFAPWYIGLPLGMLVAVHGTAGAWATLVLIATVVVSDSAQYYTGRAFGRRPLAPAISPKKTVEGAIGGVVFGTLFLAVAGPWAIGAGIVAMGLLGLVVAVLGICGDLFESRLKRASGVKDSSSLIPGHGGVLDRIDALLFAIPAFYLYLR